MNKVQQLQSIENQIKNLEDQKSKLEREIDAEQTNYDRYLKTYYGRELLKEHSLDEEGYWKVYGEDPNPDMGGSHHEPEIGLYEGKLKTVIEIAVELDRFWQWGGGGRIKKVELKKAIKV